MIRSAIRRYKKYITHPCDVYLYQMGKVGSKTIKNALENQGLTVYDEHSYYLPHDIAVGVRIKSHRAYRPSLYEMDARPSNGVRRNVLNRIIFGNDRRKIKIISLVREPISRTISRCFQDLDRLIFQDIKTDRFNTQTSGFELCRRLLEERMDHDAGCLWFDREFLPMTGIDVYAYPFDSEAGYTIIQKGRFEVLILQLERLMANGGTIASFLGLETALEFENRNTGNDKWYSPLYREFKAQYRPDEFRTASLYDTPYMKHFYTPSDISGFRRKWGLGETMPDGVAA